MLTQNKQSVYSNHLYRSLIVFNIDNCLPDKTTFYFVSLFHLNAVYCCCRLRNYLPSCMVGTDNRWIFAAKTRIRSQVNLCGIYVGQNWHWDWFDLIWFDCTSLLPFRHHSTHSTNDVYPFIRQPPYVIWVTDSVVNWPTSTDSYFCITRSRKWRCVIIHKDTYRILHLLYRVGFMEIFSHKKHVATLSEERQFEFSSAFCGSSCVSHVMHVSACWTETRCVCFQ